jgi:hypothetical protein
LTDSLAAVCVSIPRFRTCFQFEGCVNGQSRSLISIDSFDDVFAPGMIEGTGLRSKSIRDVFTFEFRTAKALMMWSGKVLETSQCCHR